MTRGGCLERVNYFSGQVLSEEDLKAEQEYFVAKGRHHNRFLHGWGVVSGLEVVIDDSGEIVVEPGVAIDCAGNTIDICDRLRLPVPPGSHTWFLVAVYVETPVRPVVVVSQPGETADATTAFTRIREEFRLELVGDNPGSGHRRKGPGTPGCGLAHAVCIARIRKRNKQWRIDLRGRR